MIQVLAVAGGMLAVLAFVGGYNVGSRQANKKLVELQTSVEVSKKLHEAELERLTRRGKELEGQLKTRKAQIQTVTKETVREIPLLVSDGKCLSAGWVRVHDAAVAGVSVASREPDGAAGEVTAARAAEVVVSNYGECLAWREQLISLQEWVRR